MRSARLVLVVIAAAVPVAGCAGDNDPTGSAAPDDSTTTTAVTDAAVTTAPLEDPLGGFVPASIEWEGCGNRRQCATVEVPLDWSDPAGPTIGIAVARVPAADDGSPPGFLAYNLGGPGADGVSSVGLPVFGSQVRFVLLGGVEIGAETLLRWYVLHVLMLPFVIVIFMAIHFWRVRKDGGISGPL